MLILNIVCNFSFEEQKGTKSFNENEIFFPHAYEDNIHN